MSPCLHLWHLHQQFEISAGYSWYFKYLTQVKQLLAGVKTANQVNYSTGRFTSNQSRLGSCTGMKPSNTGLNLQLSAMLISNTHYHNKQ
jgi:hypothetical protein